MTFAIVGTIFVVHRAPASACHVMLVATALAAATCHSLGEFGWLFAGLSVIFTLLGNGLFAMHLLGVSLFTIALTAGLLVGLVLVMLGRALIAAGSADYPYDE